MTPPPHARKRPTMHDVARAAGVSQSLVSIVFRGAEGASQETRARVLEAAAAIGYVRDERARILRSSRPSSIGVSFQTRAVFHHAIIDGLYAANRAGQVAEAYDLILSGVSDVRSEARSVQDMVSFRCGALVLLGADAEECELIRMAAGIPMVTIARTTEDPSIHWVASDEAGGVAQAMEHLVSLGHRDIVHISAPGSSGGRARSRAFGEIVERRGLSDARVVQGGSSEQDGAMVAKSLVEQSLSGGRPLPTAVLAFNDRCALGVIDVLLRAGVSVPGDVSVVGFDDSEVASRYPIDMTSVRQEPQVLAAEAIRLAVRLMEDGPEVDVPHGVVVPTALTVRSSTGEPRTS